MPGPDSAPAELRVVLFLEHSVGVDFSLGSVGSERTPPSRSRTLQVGRLDSVLRHCPTDPTKKQEKKMATTGTMQAVVFKEPFKVAVEQRPIPTVQDPEDIVVKVRYTALCGR